jgi:predicted transcriptional regulator
VTADETIHLSRRERQIMDAVYELGEATVAEVRANVPDPPSYSAVRALLRVLEEKGHLKHKQDGPRYVYMARVSRGKASRSALRRVVQTFFDGSTEAAVAALLDMKSTELSQDELDQLARMIEQAKWEGR